MNALRPGVFVPLIISGAILAASAANASAFTDADWVSLGAVNGANGTVYAMTENKSAGLFYVAGAFTAIGSTAAPGVAVWNGTNWQSLGTGLNGLVRSLALDSSGNLYAAGVFTSAGGVAVTNIAKWNGTAWSSLGAVFKGGLLAVAVDQSGNVYAGGSFTNSSYAATNIAKWNGSSWSGLGMGMNSYVNALAVDSSGNLYAGGNFTIVNGSSMPYVAEWNGSTWVPMSSGMNAMVEALAIDQYGEIFAGGTFTVAGGSTVNHVALWSGGSWGEVPASSGDGVNGTVFALVPDNTFGLYVGGIFTTAGGISASNVAFWNGNSWSAFGSGVGGLVEALGVDAGDNLSAGGSIGASGGSGQAFYLARWNGSAWVPPPGNGLSFVAYSITFDNVGNLYAGGMFLQAGGITVSNVAEWNGTNWLALGSGITYMFPPATVYSITTDPAGNLYAVGTFSSAGGVAVTNIAEWNGTHWLALSSGLSSPDGASADTVAADGKGNIYAGGNFTSAGGVAVQNIAKWNGTNWSALGGGLNNSVFQIALDKSGNVYVGGSFTEAGTTSANGVAEWNGSNWLAFGSGVGGGGAVNGLLPDNAGNLYVVGGFTSIGGVAATNAAVWNGTNWVALGAGLNGNGFNDGVYNLALDAEHNLYACGNFTNSGGTELNFLAKWNGTNWTSLGSGVNGAVTSLKTDSAGRLFLSGAFTVVGTNVSAYVAQANVVPLISSQQHNQNGSYSFNFLTAPNSTNRVFAATNLASSNWQPISTNVAPASGFLQFTDSAAIQYSNRFYRFTSP